MFAEVVVSEPGAQQPRAAAAASSSGPTYNDKYVVLYDFSDVEYGTAVEEFQMLCQDLTQAGLQTEVRPGLDKTILIFVRAPRDLLGSWVYKSRVKDWLYSITSKQPKIGKGNQVVRGAFEAEDLLSMYHLVNWSKSIGGAGITPEFGKWENVKAIFPIHNEAANKALLKHLSKKFFLNNEDLDSIRNLFGAKVAFYFAYMQTYLLFLAFPATTGFLAWLFLPKYSLIYAIITLVGCTVFLEYWKIQQKDLNLRWEVQGVGSLKVNRPKFQYEKVIVDSAGRTKHYFPKWKSASRQLLQIPFFAIALVILGFIITGVFAIELLISEAYSGPYKSYLEYLPTILLAACLPYINSYLEDFVDRLAEYENHRTADNYEMSITQKKFVLSFIAQYLPIFLTAFVYIPLGDFVVPKLENDLESILGERIGRHLVKGSFHRDPDRLRDEVIALTVTGQLSDMFEEMILPAITMKLRAWYRTYRSYRSRGLCVAALSDDPSETAFLQSVRQQAELPLYSVQDDIQEMVIQFGYLALFSPVWPLVSIGFFINNWIELRSDFLKICIDHQRPHPVRTDGIGPWIDSLDALTWLGSITTAAIVHMFGTDTVGGDDTSDTLFEQALGGGVSWWSLPITIFISEHIFLLLRAVVRFVLQRIGSEQIRKEHNDRYAERKKYLDDLEAASRMREALDVGAVERRKSVRMADPDLFWTKQVREGLSDEVGVNLIQALAQEKQCRGMKKQD